MNQTPFVDYYETLQLSPNATQEMIERVYRILAKRYHPDNLTTGDALRFSAVHDAFEVLSDSTRRAHPCRQAPGNGELPAESPRELPGYDPAQ